MEKIRTDVVKDGYRIYAVTSVDGDMSGRTEGEIYAAAQEGWRLSARFVSEAGGVVIYYDVLPEADYGALVSGVLNDSL